MMSMTMMTICEDVDDDDVGQGRSLSRIRHQVGNLDPTAQFNETPFGCLYKVDRCVTDRFSAGLGVHSISTDAEACNPDISPLHSILPCAL